MLYPCCVVYQQVASTSESTVCLVAAGLQIPLPLKYYPDDACLPARFARVSVYLFFSYPLRIPVLLYSTIIAGIKN